MNFLFAIVHEMAVNAEHPPYLVDNAASGKIQFPLVNLNDAVLSPDRPSDRPIDQNINGCLE